MNDTVISMRPFIGARNFEISRNFYRALGFEETVITPHMSVFKTGTLAFYLQDAYIKDWIDNSQVFVEVENVEQHWHTTAALNLPGKYEGVRLSTIKHFDWGSEYYLHDPSGILWHFGAFSS